MITRRIPELSHNAETFCSHHTQFSLSAVIETVLAIQWPPECYRRGLPGAKYLGGALLGAYCAAEVYHIGAGLR
eukprot:1905775-Amphidinium_carterae.3